MKHACLILAHNEFSILERLLQAIDDPRNDIFIHYDKKLKEYPHFQTGNAGLFILENRIDVRWGDVSVVEAEYALFEAATKHGSYGYYHLLSGVDMPLKSQDEIHRFFEDNQGKEFIGFSKGDLGEHIDRKVQRYHLFARHFRSSGNRSLIDLCHKTIRAMGIRLQYLLRIRRNKKATFKKGTQWISVTHELVKYMLSHKKEVLKTYKGTFCSDEIFAQTLCWNSTFREKIFDIDNEGRGCMRKIGWKNNRLKDWEEDDYDELMESEALFARKFNSKNIGIVEQILDKITTRN
ncbi:MAG: Core-2/I-Branching enzyme [Bacteroidetes bacterium]|nr:Core-2/I-Branching enzyme [Bacteroidota bacterium]